jgi:putative transposase
MPQDDYTNTGTVYVLTKLALPLTIPGMARIARIIVPDTPHHITQRGNRRQQTFFGEADYREYIALMAQWCRKYQVEIWAWCLMPNHVHLIAVPKSEDGLARAIGEAHRRYTRMINERQGWKGHLWQERFASYPMDENHLLAAARYIEMNPVAAGLVESPGDYPWSSAQAHLSGERDGLTTIKPLLSRVPEWSDFLTLSTEEELNIIKKHEKTGRPLGKDTFITTLEKRLRRVLLPQKRGPKPKTTTE